MNTNKRIILLFLIPLTSVVSCSDTSKQNKSSEKSSFKTKEAEINEIYNSFLYEKTVCQSLVKALAEDPEFIKSFESLDYRERESGQRLPAMLSKSKVAKNEAVQYVLKHIDYIFVDVDFHGGPGMTYVKNSPIYCIQTDKRLKEIEAFGPSEQSWKIREHYLNLALDNLLEFGMPGYEGPVGYDFDTFKTEVDTTKKKYSQQFNDQLKNWVQKVSIRLRGELKNTSDEFMAKEQQISTIGQWVAELRKGLE